MINTLAWTLLALRTLAIITLIELLATGKSFASLFLLIFGITYVVNRRIL